LLLALHAREMHAYEVVRRVRQPNTSGRIPETVPAAPCHPLPRLHVLREFHPP